MAHPKKGVNKPGEKDPAVAAKWAEALALRTAGKGYQEIADALGYASCSGAYDAVMGALKATLQEPADELRAMEAARLDKLMAAVWDRALSGDDFAIDRALKVMDRRARLFGLDAPQKLELSELKQYAMENDPGTL